VKQSYERASGILMAGEEIEYIAVAMRGGLGSYPDCIVATSKRLLVYHKKVLGKYEVDDCHWRDVSQAGMKEAKLGFTLTVETIQGWPLVADAIPDNQARRIIDIAYHHCERLAEAARNMPRPEAVPQEVTPAAPVAPVPAPAAPIAPPAMVAAAVMQNNHTLAAPVPASPVPAVPQPLVVPSVPQAVQPDAMAVANAAPTPESVLQSILQAQGLVDNGAPTRPMQFSAAAFQAPAVADGQPVTFRDTDTEPHMRQAPPLTTLEQIAVFSGPLAFNQIPSDTTSSPLAQYPLASDLSSSPLGKAPDSGPLPQSIETESGSLSPYSVKENPSLPESERLGDGLHSNGLVETDNGLPHGYSFQNYHTGALNNSGPIARNAMSGPLISPVETEQQREHLDALMAMSEMMGNVVTTDPNMANDFMPMPGTHSSGPLLEAAFGDGSAQGGMDSALNSGGLPTQELYMEPSLDVASDRPTDINLGVYSVSGPLSSRDLNGVASKVPRSAGSGTRTGQPRSHPDDPISKMKKLKMLLDSGFITQEDYEAKKADILARFF